MLHLYQDNPVGGADLLNSLGDVNISNPENKQIIYYDSATGTWRNYNPPFVDKDDILHTIEECTASTDPNDVAGASVIDTLNSNMTKNKIDNVLDISSYSASNPYVVPEDGYVTIGANGTSSFVQVVVKGSDGNPTGSTPEVSIGRVTGWTTTSIFVRKGMQVYSTTNTTGTVIVRYFKFL
jgi:hypothetical protein